LIRKDPSALAEGIGRYSNSVLKDNRKKRILLLGLSSTINRFSNPRVFNFARYNELGRHK
jgi:hypothetical protein